MDTLLWIAQWMLAAGFLYSGISKTFLSEKKLVSMGQTGVEGLPLPLIRFIGLIELAGVAGILLPWCLQIAKILTPVTAVGMALIMIPAAVIHTKLKEPQNVGTNIFFFLLACFVAWGRS